MSPPSDSPASLLPVDPSRILTGFTTSAALHHPHISRVPLDDAALGVHKVWSGARHTLAVPPSPSTPAPSGVPKVAWQTTFPAGSLNPGNKSAPPGGASFYLSGPRAFAAALDAAGTRPDEPQEVLMTYEVMFEDGWEWALGGKLPGVYGGAGDSAYGCTGGRQDDRCRCFDFRLMWRAKGVGELYAYAPPLPPNLAALLAVPPRSIQHPDYGLSAGRGAWCFEPGRWYVVAQRIRVGAVGAADGEIEVYIDGRSVIHAEGLVLRTPEGPDARVRGLHFSTFFGGHAPEWASPRTQHAWFANFTGAVLRPGPPDGTRAKDEL
ncbi:hypothetical protein OBBRIDRAFT_792659 [Obba rivulosa]|uniref:Polysaccharide lyase 14 domain-containing protein n=1 Tax=Obba rivulosa TaxID=1052685 RepID=A0A8E2DL08_9APHY|nr:hypothetical protein OBBRIDRAFT_792659 [Obba rivulosa]